MVAQMGGLLKVMPFISTVFVIAGLVFIGITGIQRFCCGDDGVYGLLAKPGSHCIALQPYWPVLLLL